MRSSSSQYKRCNSEEDWNHLSPTKDGSADGDIVTAFGHDDQFRKKLIERLIKYINFIKKMRGDSPLDHLPIIEGIAQHLNFKELQSLILVSRKCARFFKESEWISGRINQLQFIRKNPSFKIKDYQDNEVYCIECLRIRPWYIRDIKQTETYCLEAVKVNGYILPCIENQTEKICLEAVKQNGYALQYVKKQTYEICKEAIKSKVGALKYINIKMNRKSKWIFWIFYHLLIFKLMYLSLLIF